MSEVEVQFPPPEKISYLQRKAQLQYAKRIYIRKALTEKYLNPDQTPLRSYTQTLEDMEDNKKVLLEYELSNGWLVDDRANLPQEVSSNPLPIMNQSNNTTPESINPELPNQKIRKTPKPNLGIPLPVLNVPLPAPPPGIPVMTFNPPAQMSNTPVSQTTTELKPLVDKLGQGLESISVELNRQKDDFKTLVSNLNSQSNDVSKALSDIMKSLNEVNSNVRLAFTALHHLYVMNPKLAETAAEAKTSIQTSNDFQRYLQQFLPQ